MDGWCEGEWERVETHTKLQPISVSTDRKCNIINVYNNNNNNNNNNAVSI